MAKNHILQKLANMIFCQCQHNHRIIHGLGKKINFELVIQKTRTVRVRVPYPHCTGAARTQIVDSMDTNTLRDTQKILKKNFFSKFF